MLEWAPFESIVLFAITAPVAWAVARAWRWLLKAVWASGRDRGLTLAHTLAPVRLLLGVGVVVIALSPISFAETGPSVAIMLGVLAIVTLVCHRFLSDVAAGLLLSLQRPFTLDRQIAAGDVRGRVVDLGLTRVRLETPEGGLVDIPNRRLVGSALETAAPERRALPVRVVVTIPTNDLPAATRRQAALTNGRTTLVDELRDQVYLSAYADAGARVLIQRTEGDQFVVHATPVNPADADELKSDIVTRARLIAL